MSKPSYLSRRRVPRREYVRTVGVLVGGRYFVSQAMEISEGGMLIVMQEKLAVGQRLVITFSIPNVPAGVVRGIIRYGLEDKTGAGNTKFGIEFENLDFNCKRDIRNYVASKSEDEYKKAASESGS